MTIGRGLAALLVLTAWRSDNWPTAGGRAGAGSTEESLTATESRSTAALNPPRAAATAALPLGQGVAINVRNLGQGPLLAGLRLFLRPRGDACSRTSRVASPEGCRRRTDPGSDDPGVALTRDVMAANAVLLALRAGLAKTARQRPVLVTKKERSNAKR